MNYSMNAISAVVQSRDMNALAAMKNELIVEKMKLDKFFTMFLDKFERKMDSEVTDTPIWKLYKKKMQEYSDVDRSLKSVSYFLNKGI